MEIDYKILAVDLDHSLIKTDIFLEALLGLLKAKPYLIFALPFWAMKGRAHFKAQVVERIPTPDPSGLPYRDSVLELIRSDREKGRTILLASASPLPWLEAISKYLGVFDKVLGTSPQINLKGKAKLEAIVQFAGGKSFSYVGDSSADLAVWSKSTTGVAINPNPIVTGQLKGKPVTIQRDKTSFFKALPRLLRVHQWAKNILIFIPVFAAHKGSQIGLLGDAVIAFMSFSATVSSVYILNDLVDLESDRHHPRKKSRPLASGDVSTGVGVTMSLALLCVGLFLSQFLPRQFLYFLLGYLFVTTAYTFFVKKLIVLDVVCLALLYTVRICAGGAAVNVPVSKWLLAFSFFIFVSLAMLKRFVELRRTTSGKSLAARGYKVEDALVLSIMGISSSMLSLLVYTLYISSSEITLLYRSPDYLWLALPLFLCWICRIWILSYHDKIDDDPVIFALRDGPSYLIGAGVAIIAWMAI